MENGRQMQVNMQCTLGEVLRRVSEFEDLLKEIEDLKEYNSTLRDKLIVSNSKLIEIKNLLFLGGTPEGVMDIIKR